MTDLSNIIRKKSLNAEILSFKSSTHTVEEASFLLNCSLNQIVKSLIVSIKLSDGTIKPFLALVPGNRKLKQTLVRKLLKEKKQILIKDSKLASPQEVLDFTGYKIGGVPPILEKIETLIDSNILDEQFVFGGGGDASTLLKIGVKDLLEYNDPIIGKISK